MNSPQYLQLVDAASTGSTKTSRNWLLHDVFLDFEIAVPEGVAILKELVAVVDEADRLRVLHAEIGDRVGELRNGTGRVLPFPTT